MHGQSGRRVVDPGTRRGDSNSVNFLDGGVVSRVLVLFGGWPEGEPASTI
jgi:hypothetical protein